MISGGNFALSGHASRSLRALVGASGLALIFSLAKLLSPARQKTYRVTDQRYGKSRHDCQGFPQQLRQSGHSG